MKILTLLLLVAATVCRLPARAAAYPGNSNFRNKSAISTATDRTDWVTNITTIVS